MADEDRGSIWKLQPSRQSFGVMVSMIDAENQGDLTDIAAYHDAFDPQLLRATLPG